MACWLVVALVGCMVGWLVGGLGIWSLWACFFEWFWYCMVSRDMHLTRSAQLEQWHALSNIGMLLILVKVAFTPGFQAA
jgi:hypothetical protein